MVIVPVSVKAASSADWISASTWVSTSTRCRSQRSTSTPANGASRKVGICPAKLDHAEQQAESVSR